MSKARVAAFNPIEKVDSVEKSPPNKYFALPMTILLLTGFYPINSEHRSINRLLFTIYGFFVYAAVVVLNPIIKAIALPSLTNIDDLTNNISFLTNHAMAAFKITVFLIKRKDLLRLVETIQSPGFRPKDCSRTFSASRLINEAVRTTRKAYYIFSVFVWGLLFSSTVSAVFDVSEETRDPNATRSAVTSPQRDRTLPFHSWYPFSTQKSPNYELVFAYQIGALFITAQIVMALDTLVVGFMVHIKVQFQILSHNLRSIISHAKNRTINVSASNAATVSNETSDHLTMIIESDLERNIAHHQAIIQLSKDLESVFTYQLLLQFICSLFAYCTLLWQVSSTPVMTAKFASMLSYLGATAFQLFIYCWFGNEVMLESLSVAEAAWDSKWHEISSRRYSHGVAMIMHRSQKMIMITAGRFVNLSLDTFVMISRAAYSYFAVLKKMDG